MTKKFLKNTFRFFHSKWFKVFACIFSEISQIIIFTVFLEQYIGYVVSILTTIFRIIGTFIIINNHDNPDFKLTWVIIILTFPMFGTFLLLLLNNDRLSVNNQIEFKKIQDELPDVLTQNDIKNIENEDAISQINYIYNSSKMPFYMNTNSKYFYDGMQYFENLIQDLKQAKKFIFMEYFIISQGYMWDTILNILKEKSEMNIPVYVLYDDFGCMSQLDYFQKLNKNLKIHFLPSNECKPLLSKFHNNRDHRKITVIDNKIAYTGGINLADEYINKIKKFGYWKDCGIRLEGDAVKSFTFMFMEFWNMQCPSNLRITDNYFVEYKSISNGIVVPYNDGPSYFYEDEISKNVYLNLINSSKKFIYITTPYLICDTEILNALCNSSKRGVDVKIITPGIPDKKIVFLMNKSNYEKLIYNGVKIHEYSPGFIHAKNFISDGKFATCGTVNLDYRSLAHHFECGVWMYNTTSIKEMLDDYNNTLKSCKKISYDESKLKTFPKIVSEIFKIFYPLF